MTYPILQTAHLDPPTFVDFWAALYPDDDRVYFDNIQIGGTLGGRIQPVCARSSESFSDGVI